MNLLKKYSLFFLLIFSMISCKDNKIEKKEIIDKPKVSNLNFDKILKLDKSIYNISKSGGFFTTSYDYGTMYDPKRGNDFGNLVTFMIPKDFLYFKKHLKYPNEDDDNDKLENDVNALSIEELKETFNIYVFLIDKKYLIPTPGYDSPYDVKKQYKTDLYHFKNNSWEKIESFTVDSDETDNKEMNWRNDFIEKKSNELQTAFFDSITKLKIDDSWYRDYVVSLDSFEPGYGFAFYINMKKDSCYIKERLLDDLLVPYQDKDTLFLFHKKCLFKGSKYLENKQIPEVKIVKTKENYYVTSEVFDLKNSITSKPEKYGFPVMK